MKNSINIQGIPLLQLLKRAAIYFADIAPACLKVQWCAVVVLSVISACTPCRESKEYGTTVAANDADILYELPEGQELGSLFYCDSSSAFCCLTRRPGHDEASLLCNGAVIAKGDAFKNIAFSRNGKRFVYAIRDLNRRWTVVDNGSKQGPYDEVYHWTMTDDGHHYAYEVIDSSTRRYCVIQDGKKIGQEFRSSCSPAYSPDGSHFAFVAVLENNRSLIMLNDKALEPRESVSNPVFSPNGLHMAYTAYDSDGCYFQLLNGPKIGPYFTIEESCLGLDRLRYAFIAKKKIPENETGLPPMSRKGTYYAVSNDHESSAFEIVKDPMISPDSKCTLFRVFHDDKWRLLINGSIMLSADEDIWKAVFVPPDNRIAYLTGRDKTWRVICGDHKSDILDAVHLLWATPDGEIRFIASHGRKIVRDRLRQY